MGFSLYLVFRNQLLRPNRTRRLVLLSVLFLVYLFLGSYISFTINLPIEQSNTLEWQVFKSEWHKNHSCIDSQELDEFIELVVSASSNGIVWPEKSANFTQNWTFGGETLFFVFTLLATIGYGNAAPLTLEGRLFCIFYVIVGVPLTMIILTIITERIEFKLTNRSTLTDNSRQLKSFSYKSYASIGNRQMTNASCVHTRGAMNVYLETILIGLFWLLVVYVIPSLVFSTTTENWSLLDSVYFCFVSVTTIGFGDIVPGEGFNGDNRGWYRLLMTIYLFVGIITNMLFLNILIRLPILRRIKYLLNLRFKRRKYYELFEDDEQDQLVADQTDNNTTTAEVISHSSSSSSISNHLTPRSVNFRPTREI